MNAARKLTLATLTALCVSVLALMFTSAPALAAPPEEPVTFEAFSIGAIEATLEGELSPHSPGELGLTYQFVYRPSSSECRGAGEVKTPEPAGLSLGGEGEFVFQPVSGLTQATEYAVCLIARNGKGEETVGSTATFKTLVPEPPQELKTELITATTATVHGILNPRHEGEAGSYEFLYRQSASECAGGEHAGGGKASGQEGQAVSASLTGLTPGRPYSVCLSTSTEAGRTAVSGPPVTFTTAPAPAIESATAANLTASSVDLSAEVDPNGEATTCAIEYGTSTGYGTSLPCEPASLGSGTAAVPVSRHLEGLSADTTYHWRVVATNATGTSAGPDHAFVYTTTGALLPDDRAYELVTPPAKNGASVDNVVIAAQGAISDDGSRVMAPSIQCFAASESCTGDREQEGEPFEFTRTAGGWVTTPLAPPASEFVANAAWEVSAEAGTALFSMPTPPGNEDDFYARQPAGSFLDIGPVTPPGTTGIGNFQSEFKHATADLSHLVFGTVDQTWPFDLANGETLHEYYGTGNAKPFLVAVTGGEGSTELIGICETHLGGGETPSALSADGRTVYFTVSACGAGGSGTNAGVPVPAAQLYARIDGEAPGAHTVAISQPECGVSLGCKEAEPHPSDAAFAGASEDGSRALFLDTQQLTADATEGIGSESGDNCSRTDCNLYEYDLKELSGHNLIDVSAGDTSGLGPRVQGVMASSPDGSRVYFVAQGVLSSAPNGQGQSAQAAQNNLYLYERDSRHPEGHVTFIADLPSRDADNWHVGQGFPPLANVTPGGRFLVFQSHGDLTADDTRADGSAQIFRYDAETEELTRISIGDRGFGDDGNVGTGDATIVPADYAEFRAGPSRRDPTMSNDGAYVFFQSPVALAPHALNDVAIDSAGALAQNVYEYHDGRVHLISDGRDVGETNTPCGGGGRGSASAVCLLGTDATGANVFFTGTDQLVRADADTQTDIYDARVCTAGSPCVADASAPLPPCLGEACHGIPAATPSPPAPGSASFNGQGNIVPEATRSTAKPPVKSLARPRKLAKALRACKAKHNKKKRSACEASAKRKYGPVKAKAKKAGNKRRAK